MPRPGPRDAIALSALAAFVVVLVLVETRWNPLRRFDLAVAGDLNAWTAHHDTAREIVKGVTNVGQPVVFHVLAVLAAIVLVRRGEGRQAAFVAITVLGSSVLSSTLKYLVDRGRPDVEITLATAGGSSFPSGHALASAAACGVAVVLVRTHRTVVLVAAAVVAAAVGFSRLALGVHYVSDVVGAWLAAVAWIGATTALLLSDRPRSPARPGDSTPPAGTRRPSD